MVGGGFHGGSDSKESTCSVGDLGLREFLCWENPLKEGLATDSNVLAWKILMDMEFPWKSLAGYILWGLKESETIERPRTAQKATVGAGGTRFWENTSENKKEQSLNLGSNDVKIHNLSEWKWSRSSLPEISVQNRKQNILGEIPLSPGCIFELMN